MMAAAAGANAAPRSSAPVLLVFVLLILLRILVSLHHHSGESNHHGKAGAYGGDYEAQRHWMEVTYHLPLRQWYTYDVDYWGLDYPPLTAYHSYLCGWASHFLVGKETVALDASRGYEEVTHKAFMRGTVLVFDVMIYFTAVWAVAQRLHPNSARDRLWVIALALAQPSLILIDHGHFQYNSISLGLALWSFHYMTLDGSFYRNCVLGSIFFCLSLNFKQMALYYAPAVFAYLLGRCFEETNAAGKLQSGLDCLAKFTALGTTVIFSFSAIWAPFVILRSEDDAVLTTVTTILSRIFPFGRGLYEGKVSNIWCALSTRPFSYRTRVPERLQPLFSLGLTVLLFVPACAHLFLVGRGTSARRNQDKLAHLKALLGGSASASLAFFLASFQVHEKSILLPLAPASLLVVDAPLLVCWFSIASVWTMWHLLQVDRLHVPYLVCIFLYGMLCYLYDRPILSLSLCRKGNRSLREDFGSSQWPSIVVVTSVAGMVGLHFVECAYEPPTGLPDLFEVIWSIVGCGIFCICWATLTWTLTSRGTVFDSNGEKKQK